MLVLVVVLAATNLVTLVLLVRTARARRVPGDSVEMFEAPRPAGVRGNDRRLVYEQTLRVLRRELQDKDVLADVRVHSLRAVPKEDVSQRRSGIVDATVVDQVAPLDLGDPPG